MKLSELSGNPELSTSEAAAEKNAELAEHMSANLFGPARLALGLSLADKKPIKTNMSDMKGAGIRAESLFSNEKHAWVAMINEHAGRSLNKKEFRVAVAAHWERGINKLFKLWVSVDKDFNKFLTALLEQHAASGGVAVPRQRTISDDDLGGEIGDLAVRLDLGTFVEGNDADKYAEWHINASGHAPHIAIMGGSGVGKTQLGLKLAKSVSEQSGCATFIFDMKGDISKDTSLCRALGAEIINCPGDAVPLDILHVADRSDNTQIQNTAARLGDSLACASSRANIGAVQRDRIRDITARLLAQKSNVSLDDVASAYSESGEVKNNDSVIASLKSICAYRLFKPEQPPSEFFKGSWIFNMKDAADEVQRFSALMLLDALYRYFGVLSEAPTDADDNRKIRALLVVDEAHKILGLRHPAVSNILRVSRSKGGSVMLISQSPKDYVNDETNLLENIGGVVCFRAMADPSDVKKVFHERVRVDKLEIGICLARLAGHDKPIEKIKAWEK